MLWQIVRGRAEPRRFVFVLQLRVTAPFTDSQKRHCENSHDFSYPPIRLFVIDTIICKIHEFPNCLSGGFPVQKMLLIHGFGKFVVSKTPTGWQLKNGHLIHSKLLCIRWPFFYCHPVIWILFVNLILQSLDLPMMYR